MDPLYPRNTSPGFGNPDASDGGGNPRPKPLKRPRQARAKFTVQAIFDAFVRIWLRDGWTRLTTRAVALETGISTGTLYEYFPNKVALLSGYFRHNIDVLLSEIDNQAIQPADLGWQERLRRLIRLTCDLHAPELPYFDARMLQLEAEIAEPKHHRRVFDEMSAKWIEVVQACADLPDKPDADAIRSLYLSAWGGKRYLLLVNADEALAGRWREEFEGLCRLRLQGG